MGTNRSASQTPAFKFSAGSQKNTIWNARAVPITKTPDKLKINMVTPGGAVEYDIPVATVQQFTLEKLFEKNLLLLIPFYIFSHESRFAEYEKDSAKLQALQREYEFIRHKLEALLQQGVISEYTRHTVIDMSNKVLEHIAIKFSSVREGVKSVMGGKILDYEAKTIRSEGVKAGIDTGIRGTVSILKNLGIPPQTILQKIQEQYGLSAEASKKYL